MTIPLFKVYMNENVKTEVPKVLLSGMITQSIKVDEFEKKLREYLNHPYVVTVNSATAALTLGCIIAGSKGNDVISTPLTCFATTSAILASGVRNIVWADVDKNTCNIDLDDVKKKITKHTKVLVYVHWAGVPVDPIKVQNIKEYAKAEFNTTLKVVEDGAHAFGAEWNGKKIGTHGNFAAFSFQAIKHLTTGDGGALLCPDEDSYKRAKRLRWYGIDRNQRTKGKDIRMEPDIIESGYKFHMNDISATIGLCNLPNIDNILTKCRENAVYYNNIFDNYETVGLIHPIIPDKAYPSYWIYTIRVLFNQKKEFIKYMTQKGIMVSQVHARNDKNSCVSHFKTPLPSLDRLEKEIVSIPVGWWITSIERKYIADCCIDFSSKYVLCRLDQVSKYWPVERSGFKITKCEEYTELVKQKSNCDNCLSSIELEEIYVLMLKGIMIATAKLHIETKLYNTLGHIEDVFVKKEYRGQGYGNAMVTNIIKISKDEGCYKTVLNCSEHLSDFYKECGMKQTGYSFTAM